MLSDTVKEFFAMLETTTDSHITPGKIWNPISISCSRPSPARENLNAILEKMRTEAGIATPPKYWRGQLYSDD